MAHSPVRDQLVVLAAGTAGDPMGFLEGLSDIHVSWHSENLRTYGFLLFHHRVVRYFEDIVNTGLEPSVEPYTEADLRGLGAQPFGVRAAGVDSLGELAVYARAIESWHNPTHGIIAAATGTPLGDPAQNIFFRPFWQLHLYIDGLFRIVLRQYGDMAHINQLLSPDAVASHLEVSHHPWVPRI